MSNKTNSQPSPAPVRWSDLDPYLKPLHLGTNVVTVTIDRVEFHKTHPRPGMETIAPVMYFVKKQKGLILNNTNQDWLHENFGDDIKNAYGKKITLYTGKKKIAGQTRDVVLMKLPDPNKSA